MGLEQVVQQGSVGRRAVLVAAAAGAGAVALAACSSSGSGSTATGATTPASTEPAGSSSAGASSGGAGAAVSGLVALDKIPVGEAVSAKLADGSPVLVARPTETTAACFSAICTHMGCTVNPAGKELHCPCHGSVYNATTGAVIHGPAPKALAAVAVHVESGEVVAG